MRKSLMAVAVLLFSMSFSQAALADDIQTLGEYSGTGIFPDPGPYQPPTVVGTFTIDPGDTSLMISGAGSDGRRNTFLQFTRRSLKS
jgi:hypothetical protein